MKNKQYNGYTIKRKIYQGTTCYTVTRPNGYTFPDLAPNLETAKKWADADIVATRERQANRN